MKILNGRPRFFPFRRPAKPHVHVFSVRGTRFALDSNALLLAELDDSDPVPEGVSWQPVFRTSPPPAIRCIVLVLTDRCNLACDYCFVREQGEAGCARPGETMDEQTALDALALLDPQRPLRVSFFGGEPLLCFDLIQKVVEHAESLARRRNQPTAFHLTTNGTLLTPEIVRFLEEHRFSLIVSLDGDADQHDAVRHFPGGAGSHAKVLHGLHTVAAHANVLPRRTTLRATFVPENMGLAQRLEYLNGLCDEGLAAGVSVEPASVSEGCVSGFREVPRGDLAMRVVEEYARASEWFVGRVRSGRRARFMHYEKMMARVRLRAAAPSECGAGFGYVAVGPDRKLYACHRMKPGEIGRPGKIDESARSAWRNNRYTAKPQCRSCWARNICGGGCRLDALKRTGSVSGHDKLQCFFRKLWIREAAWLLAQLQKDEIGKREPAVAGRGAKRRYVVAGARR